MNRYHICKGVTELSFGSRSWRFSRHFISTGPESRRGHGHISRRDRVTPERKASNIEFIRVTSAVCAALSAVLGEKLGREK